MSCGGGSNPRSCAPRTGPLGVASPRLKRLVPSCGSHDANASTPIRCAGDDGSTENFYAPYAYDAVYALAYGLHELVAVRNLTSVVPRDLLDVLTNDVAFDGLTGRVAFQNHNGGNNDGDRGGSVSYALMNYQSNAAGLVQVGLLTVCSGGLCAPWEERWHHIRPFTFSTADNTLPSQDRPRTKPRQVRIGWMLPMFGTNATGYTVSSWWRMQAGTYQALREINNKSDDVADSLLPDTQLRFTNRDSRCDGAAALDAALDMTRNAFGGLGVSAIIGAGCSAASEVVARVAQVAGFIPVISPSSTSSTLSNGRAFPSFLRTPPAEDLRAQGIVETFLHLFNYTSVFMIQTDIACDPLTPLELA